MKPLQRGDRIRLVAMPDDPDPVQPGSTGTVLSATPHRFGSTERVQVDVAWDNGRKLMLVMPPDEVEVITDAHSARG